MPTFNYSNSDFVDGQTATAAVFNTRFLDLKTFLNTTKLDSTNIQSSAVITQLLADNNVTADKLSAAVRDAIGINSASTVHRGKSIIATEESRSNTAYGLMPTHDEVLNVVLPTDGLIRITYDAMFKSSTGGQGLASLFLGSNQIVHRAVDNTDAVGLAPVEVSATGTDYRPLMTWPGGLVSWLAPSAVADPPTTGVALGMTIAKGAATSNFLAGPNPNLNFGGGSAGAGGATAAGDSLGGACLVWAAAGAYTVSAQFKAASGSVTAKNRKLWVEAVGF